uniref:Uncharacterized protein n=1 Tax=Eutreptiella gymnastica TaxID=73025 RepID=A0A7S4FXF3_9EUGL
MCNSQSKMPVAYSKPWIIQNAANWMYGTRGEEHAKAVGQRYGQMGGDKFTIQTHWANCGITHKGGGGSGSQEGVPLTDPTSGMPRTLFWTTWACSDAGKHGSMGVRLRHHLLREMRLLHLRRLNIRGDPSSSPHVRCTNAAPATNGRLNPWSWLRLPSTAAVASMTSSKTSTRP